MADKILVWAQGEYPTAYRTAEGDLVPGRYVARERAAPYAPLPEGEEVPAHVDILRDVRRGHLTTQQPAQPASVEPAHAAIADRAPPRRVRE